GDSFAAICACSSTMTRLSTVTVSAAEIDTLMNMVEGNPQTRFAVDIDKKSLSYGTRTIAIDLLETHRSALTSGSWDSTTLLRANLDRVKKTATKLPYMTGFPG